MKKQLSSSLTFIYKFGFPTIWTLIILGLCGLIYLDSGEIISSLVPMIILPIIIPFIKLKAITFDSGQLYISNGFDKSAYELTDLESINPGHVIGLKPFWDIRLQDKKGETIKIHFIPKLTEQLHYFLTGENNGQLKEIQEIIKSKTTAD